MHANAAPAEPSAQKNAAGTGKDLMFSRKFHNRGGSNQTLHVPGAAPSLFGQGYGMMEVDFGREPSSQMFYEDLSGAAARPPSARNQVHAADDLRPVPMRGAPHQEHSFSQQVINDKSITHDLAVAVQDSKQGEGFDNPPAKHGSGQATPTAMPATPKAAVSPLLDKLGFISFVLDVDFDQWTAQKKESELKSTLAKVANVDPGHIRIMHLQRGSVIAHVVVYSEDWPSTCGTIQQSLNDQNSALRKLGVVACSSSGDSITFKTPERTRQEEALKDLPAKLDAALQARDQAQAQQKGLEDQVKAGKTDIDALRKQLSDMEAQAASSKAEADSLRAQVSSLRADVTAAHNAAEAARRQSEQGKKDSLEKVQSAGQYGTSLVRNSALHETVKAVLEEAVSVVHERIEDEKSRAASLLAQQASAAVGHAGNTKQRHEDHKHAASAHVLGQCATVISVSLLFNSMTDDEGFHAFDNDGDGELSREDMLASIKKLGITDIEKHIMEFHRLADTSGKGRLRKQDWTKAIASANVRSLLLSNRRPAAEGHLSPNEALGVVAASLLLNHLSIPRGFEAFDRDKDGHLSVEDLRRTAEILQLGFEPQEIRTLHASMTGGHGGDVSKEQWAHALSHADINSVLRSRHLFLLPEEPHANHDTEHLVSLQEEISRLESELAVLRTQVGEKQNTVEELTRKFEQAKHDSDSYMQQVEHLNKSNADLSKQLAEAEQNIKTLPRRR
jgi:Ca2+-binding EF-hand superfamily protein/predicted  nucleic acid-binding Zn-ribbon protein